MNPFDALAIFVLGKIKEGLWAAWFKFLFELVFSAVVSFLIAFSVALGGALAANTEAVVALLLGLVGGMSWAAIALVMVFRKERSRLTKGMFVVVPEIEAEKEIQADAQVIEKP